MNKVILIGYLGRDPELRYTQTGMAVANFTVATTERWKKDGEAHEKTEWHRIVVWGNTAEFAGKYLKKGRLITLEGKLQTREWEDREGHKRSTTEIVANNVQALGPKPSEEEQEQREPDPTRREPEENDIPF